MKRTLSALFFALLLTVSLLSCSDHRLGGPASPARLRLQSLQSVTPTSTANYVYNYDSQNRPTSINRTTGGTSTLAILAYGDPQQKYTDVANEIRTLYVEYPNPADQTTGTITPYPAVLDGTSFTATKYQLINGKLATSNTIRSYAYSFDASKQLTGYVERSSSTSTDLNAFTYVVTGSNVTTEGYNYAGGRGDTGSATYTYDGNPNPLFGLLDPALGPIQYISRNNVLSRTNASNRGINSGVTTYSYTYNPQGLPTQRTATYNGAVTETLTYGYESY